MSNIFLLQVAADADAGAVRCAAACALVAAAGTVRCAAGVAVAAADAANGGAWQISVDFFEHRLFRHVVGIRAWHSLRHGLAEGFEQFPPERRQLAVSISEIHGHGMEQRPAVIAAVALVDQFRTIHPAVAGQIAPVVFFADMAFGCANGVAHRKIDGHPLDYEALPAVPGAERGREIAPAAARHPAGGSGFDYAGLTAGAGRYRHVVELQRIPLRGGVGDGLGKRRALRRYENEVSLTRHELPGGRAGRRGLHHKAQYADAVKIAHAFHLYNFQFRKNSHFSPMPAPAGNPMIL